MTARLLWVVVTHAMLPNGSSHRFVRALQREGYDVAFCATPLPGASMWRAERMLPGSAVPQVLADKGRPVPLIYEMRAVIDLGQFAWKLANMGYEKVILIGCDPLSFLEAITAFRCSPVRLSASAVWFVDWSAQRLQHPVTAVGYRAISRASMRLANITAAISPAAADALGSLRRSSRDVVVLPNLPMPAQRPVPWAQRERVVAYVGGLSEQQGVAILIGAAAVLVKEGVSVHVVGDGPASDLVVAAARLPGVHFYGLMDDSDELAAIIGKARVGWALYDPDYPMHIFGDSLKIKDYMAAGTRVVSTLPTSLEDGVITAVSYSVVAVVEGTRRALTEPPAFEPSTHELVLNAHRSFERFVDAVLSAQ